jgi:TatD DNase family protein
MMLVDSHCHLDSADFNEDREAVIERALQAGVNRMVAVGTGEGPPDLEAGIRLAERYSAIYATAGVHPHDAAKATGETMRKLRELAGHTKVLAIGEIGLDYHYDFSPRDRQRAVFIEQLDIAREVGLPVVIHTREAWEDTLEILRQHWSSPPAPGLMHCFTGNPAEARDCFELGFYVSFGGILTFPKATGIQQAAREAPADRILIETDAPYLAPVPRRGKRNEPAFVVHTAAKLAELRGIEPETAAQQTSSNFERLFEARLSVGLQP